MFNIELLTKKRREIMGVAIIYVIIFHCYSRLAEKMSIPILTSILNNGNIGVEIFLFLSGIGLYFSMSKDESILPFYSRRITRVIVPWLIMSFPYWILKSLIADKDNIGGFLMHWSGLSFWINGVTTVWYVAFIILLYFAYPFIFRLQKKNDHFVLLTAAAVVVLNTVLLFVNADYYSKVEIALTRIPVFLLGSYMGSVLKKKNWNSKKQAASIVYIILTLIVFLIGKYASSLSEEISVLLIRYGEQSVAFIIIICSCLIFNKLTVKPIVNIFTFMGGITLEAYLLHVFMLNVVSRTGMVENSGNLVHFLIKTAVVAASVFCAWAFSTLYTKFLNRNKKKA